MVHRAFLSLGFFAILAANSLAFAQVDEEFSVEDTEEEDKPAPEPDTGGEPDLGGPELPNDPGAAKAAKEEEAALGESRVSWQDIVVVVRKPFLKMRRVELTPSIATTMNDNMISHYALNAQINYFLTDVLAVGIEGQYFAKNLLETYDQVALTDRRLPTLNKYNYGAALNFHYVPIYGKFATLNKSIVHWEIYATAGVGFTQSEVIPRDPALPSWTNFLITPNLGLTARVFLAKWLTFNVGVRDYVFIDKYENVNRTAMQSVEEAKAGASSQLVNHIMFMAGLSFWVPTGFEYTTFR